MAAWATRVSCRSSGGTASYVCYGSTRAPTRSSAGPSPATSCPATCRCAVTWEALGLAELVLEQVEGVGKGVADGNPEAAQAEALGDHSRLVSHADRGVDQVAVVEAQPRVDDDLLHAQ